MIVSELFGQRRLPLPVVTTVQVGALSAAGVQVVMEAITVSRQPVNPGGLAFVAAQAVDEEGLPARVAPLARKSIPKLLDALKAAGLESQDVLRATCFVSSMEDVGDVRGLLASSFPKAVFNVVQPERAPSHAVVACEAVARLRAAPAKSVVPPSAVAFVTAPRVVLAGSQMAFGYDEENARLAFQRLEKTLEQQSSSLQRVAVANIYGLSRAIGERALKIGAGFFDNSQPPASMMIPCVGLPALDASFALDVVAVASNSK
jgi:enamine deaminase RidA (YjgF/YER057c/UK114 family)